MPAYLPQDIQHFHHLSLLELKSTSGYGGRKRDWLVIPNQDNRTTFHVWTIKNASVAPAMDQYEQTESLSN